MCDKFVNDSKVFDTVIHNAGIMLSGKILNSIVFDSTLQTNFYGPV